MDIMMEGEQQEEGILIIMEVVEVEKIGCKRWNVVLEIGNIGLEDEQIIKVWGGEGGQLI